MISVQVPHFFNHHPLPGAYSPMSSTHPAFFNGMSAFTKPQPMASYVTDVEKPKSISNGGKRRPSRAGTRSVATLTAAQLERKRANDREAQRAIRQRTKDHIESLERRIQELTSTSDMNARLAQALARVDDLEQENKVLRSRINSTASALAEGQPISQEMLTGPQSPTRRLRAATRASSVPSVPTAPRSIPAAINTHMPHDFNFNSPVSTGMDRSPSLADVSPVSSGMHRWGAPPHPSPITVHHSNGVVVDHHGQHQVHHQVHQVHHVDANGVPHPQHSPVAYNYMMEANDRQLSYSPAGGDHGMMAPFPTPASVDGVSGGFPSSGPGGPQMTPTMPSPAFAQFPGTPQSYIATSPHEPDHATQQLMNQAAGHDGQNVMFTMPSDKE